MKKSIYLLFFLLLSCTNEYHMVMLRSYSAYGNVLTSVTTTENTTFIALDETEKKNYSVSEYRFTVNDVKEAITNQDSVLVCYRMRWNDLFLVDLMIQKE